MVLGRDAISGCCFGLRSRELPWPQHLMKRQVLIFGLVGGVLIALLKWTEYRFMVIDHAVGIYGGLTAVTFAVLGIWLGLKLTKPPRETVVVKEIMVPAAVPFVPSERKRD